MASKKNTAFTRSAAAMIAASGVDYFMERVEGRLKLTDQEVRTTGELVDTMVEWQAAAEELLAAQGERIDALEKMVKVMRGMLEDGAAV